MIIGVIVKTALLQTRKTKAVIAWRGSQGQGAWGQPCNRCFFVLFFCKSLFNLNASRISPGLYTMPRYLVCQVRVEACIVCFWSRHHVQICGCMGDVGWLIAETFGTDFCRRTSWQRTCRGPESTGQGFPRCYVHLTSRETLTYALKIVMLRSSAFVLPYRVSSYRCHAICRLEANFKLFFISSRANFGLFSMQIFAI